MFELNQKRRLSKAKTSMILIFGERRKKKLKRIKVLLYNTVVFCPFKILF